jgi:hypothetical protein
LKSVDLGPAQNCQKHGNTTFDGFGTGCPETFRPPPVRVEYDWLGQRRVKKPATGIRSKALKEALKRDC